MSSFTLQIGALTEIGACLKFNICIINGWKGVQTSTILPKRKGVVAGASRKCLYKMASCPSMFLMVLQSHATCGCAASITIIPAHHAAEIML